MKNSLCLAAILAATIVFSSGGPHNAALKSEPYKDALKSDHYKAALKSDPYKAAGNHHPYIVPEYSDTKAPHGYKAFYLSHYGRHGSRYLTSRTVYLRNIRSLEALSSSGLLTAEGEALKNDFYAMRKAHEGLDGILSQKGSREHQGISRRMYRRARGVFRQKDRREVLAVSSPVTRCVQSAANFLGELKAVSPDLEIQLHSGHRYMAMLAHESEGEISDSIDCIVKHVTDSLESELLGGPDVGKTIFTDISAVRQALGSQSLHSFMYGLLHEASIAKCLDTDVDPFSHFSEDELFAFGLIFNARVCSWFSRSRESGQIRDTAAGIPVLRDFILKADEALKEGSRRCADLRFGHDTGIGPLMSLLKLEGYDKTPSLADSYKVWPAYEYIPMGSNCQMIFYRNGKGELLVKILRNEKETTIPAVPTFSGPYYRWQDLREYCARLCGLD